MQGHGWHLVDAEDDVYARVRDDETVELGHPDRGVEQRMTWAEFDRWRERREGDGQSES